MPHRSLSFSLRVLVVEDSLINQKLLTHMLVNFGCDVTIACDGEEAVNAISEQSFDMVLMDVQMPVMDGLTATRIIREREENTGKRVLIIAVTAGVDRETCLRAGMDDHLSKPVRMDVMQKTLEQATASA